MGWIAPAAIAMLLSITLPAFAGITIKVEEGASEQTVEVLSDSAVAIESGEPFAELLIANPDIADISSISGTTLYVLGKQPGRTTLMLIRSDNSIISTIDIRVSPDITELTTRLDEVFPNEEIEVRSANDGLVLSGTVSSPEVVSRALEVAGHYAQGRISNLMNVLVRETPPEPAVVPQPVAAETVIEPVNPMVVQAQIRAILPNEPVTVHDLGGTLVLSGNVSSQESAQQALQIARLVAEGADVSNLLTVAEIPTCKVRTRRGGELIETTIPCGKS
ncbi:MAG: pilus assembly protein N-terminal domain-containing protein [Roseobacter sp.]